MGQQKIEADEVRGLIAGDSDAIESVRAKLYRFALGKTRDSHNAEDAVQELFASLYSTGQIYSLDESRDAGAFLRTSVKRKIIDRFRKEQRREAQSIDRMIVHPQPDKEYLDNGRALYAEKILAFMEAEDVAGKQALEAFALKHVRGLSYRAISQLIDVPETTVQTRIHRAGKRLRIRYEEQFSDVA